MPCRAREKLCCHPSRMMEEVHGSAKTDSLFLELSPWLQLFSRLLFGCVRLVLGWASRQSYARELAFQRDCRAEKSSESFLKAESE